MFYNSKVNYKSSPVIPKYPAIELVYQWTKDVPTTDGLDANLITYLKPKWVYKAVKHNFQTDINNQYLITPKMIATTGIEPPNKDVPFQKVPLNSLNATDIRNLSKNVVDSYINKKTNDYVASAINQSKKNNNDPKDLEIQKLKSEIDNLKKGNSK